jgi:hypothetical protein
MPIIVSDKIVRAFIWLLGDPASQYLAACRSEDAAFEVGKPSTACDAGRKMSMQQQPKNP